jgi:hypothetical protein
MPPFYNPCFVEVRNSVLSSVWLCLGAAIVVFQLVALFGSHGYTDKYAPVVDVKFWQDVALDGNWWPSLQAAPAAYCNHAYEYNYSDGSRWGGPSVGCVRPQTARSTYFYPESNELRIATSIAYGENPQWNTTDVFIYEGIEDSTIALFPSVATPVETLQHVPDCRVFDTHGAPITNRYEALYPDHTYGNGVLLLSVSDLVAAAGKSLDGMGAEGAPLRLTGFEMVAHVDVRNYEGFRWPFSLWNPFNLLPADTLECTVRFAVLRDQFTPVHWFYDRDKPAALQHGIRLVVLGTGSIGYFSWGALLTKTLLCFTAFSFAQQLLDMAWYYLYPHSRLIAAKAYQALDLRKHHLD